MYAIVNSLDCFLLEEVDVNGNQIWGDIDEAAHFPTQSVALQAAFKLGSQYHQQFGELACYTIELVLLEKEHRVVVGRVF